MVHALKQAHRVLVTSGRVLDLRPWPGDAHRARRLPVYCRANGRETWTGAVSEPADYLADYRAADRALTRILDEGVFLLRSAERFPFRYYFRSLDALERTLRTLWLGTSLGPATRRRLVAEARKRPRAEIVVVEPFHLNILVKR